MKDGIKEYVDNQGELQEILESYYPSWAKVSSTRNGYIEQRQLNLIMMHTKIMRLLNDIQR